MSAQTVLRSLLAELVESAAKDRADEAPEAWAALEKFARSKFESDDEVALLASVLLDQSEGLPAFVAESVKYKGQRDGHAKVREAIYKWLDSFLRSLPAECARRYAAATIDSVAVFGFRRETDNYCRAASLLPLQAALELRVGPWATDGQKASALADQLQSVYLRDKKASETVKAAILESLGLFVEASPEGAFVGGSFRPSWLLDECRSVLDRIAASGKAQAGLAAGALAGLSAAFAACKEDEGQAVNAVAWDYFLRTIRNVDGLKRYQGLKAAMRMVITQTSRFRAQLTANARVVFEMLTSLKATHSNKDVRAAAEDTITAALHEVGEAMCAEGAEQKTHALILGYFTHRLTDPKTSGRELTVAVQAVGELAAATKKFFGDRGVEKLLEYLAPLGQKSALAQGPNDSSGENITYDVALLRALSRIMIQLPHIPEMTLQQSLDIANRVSRSYPSLWPKQQLQVHIALCSLLAALAPKQALLIGILPRLVACLLTHTLRPSEATSSSQPGGSGSKDADTSWKAYLLLWAALIKGGGLPKQDAALGSQLHLWSQPLYDALLTAVLDALRNLDLEYHQAADVPDVPDSHTAPLEITDQEEEGTAVQADIGAGLRPQNLADMRAFLNLSGFLTDFLPLCGGQPFRGWADVLGVELMAGASNRPLLSGFYRMMAVALRLSEEGGLFSQDEADAGHLAYGQVVGGWLREVAVASRRYRDELLSAVLDLLLSAPPTLIRPTEMLGPIQAALSLGLQCPPLAATALRALERLEGRSKSALNELAPAIVPLLEPYLLPISTTELPVQGASPGGDDSAERSEAGGKGEADEGDAAAKEAFKRIRAEAETAAKRAHLARFQGLAALQPKIQAWLGRLGGAADALVLAPSKPGQADNITSRRWDAQDKFGIRAALPGLEEPVLWLDTILPLAAELAEKSAERATRVAACEFLHAAILWMVGTNARRPMSRDAAEDFQSRPTAFHGILSRALPVALRLAAGAEPVARQLFEPLVMSLVHWFTRAARREAAETMALLDAIMEGLADSQNGALRELCASATREFLVWSAKHIPSTPAAPGKAAAGGNLNAASLLRRLFDRLAHPEPYQRLGASLALKQCAAALAREPDLADEYMLQALQEIVQALRAAEADPAGTGTRQQAAEAMQELVRAMYKRPKIVDKLRSSKATRQGLPDLSSFLEWLWPLTAAPQRFFRGHAMWLHKHLATLLLADTSAEDGKSQSASAAWVAGLMVSEGKTELQVAQDFLMMSSAVPAVGGTQMKRWLQDLEGRLHWAVWGIEQGFLHPDTLAPSTSRSKAKNPHLVVALEQYFDLLHASHASEGRNKLAGVERETQRLASRALAFLKAVVGKEVVSQDSPRLHHFLLAALLSPHSLGIPPSEDEAARKFAADARGILELASKKDKVLLLALKPALAENLAQTPLLQQKTKERAAGSSDQTAMDIFGSKRPDFVAWLRGLTLLAELDSSLDPKLLPTDVKTSLPQLLLDTASRSGASVTPKQRPVMERALNLAIRLGLKTSALLDKVLDAKSGAAFYESFRRAVHSWVLWNASTVCQPLCEELSSDARGAADTAERVLFGTLEALLRGPVASHTDPRARSFLGQLLPALPHLRPMLAEGAASSERWMAFLRILRQLLELDAALVLSPAQQASRFLLDGYIIILKARGGNAEQQSRATQARTEALRLLAPFLALPADTMRRILAAVEGIATDLFPAISHELPRGSTQSIDYATQLIAMLDAAVAAAESGTRVEALLEALLPVLREMGTSRGHTRQSSLETRLALIAAAPWKSARTGQTAGNEGSSTSAAAELQATSLLNFAWGFVFEAPGSTLHFLDIRRAMLHHVLLPALRFAPLAFQKAYLTERAPRLRDILSRAPISAPGLLGDEEAGLYAREAAYYVLQHIYAAIPPADIKEQVLATIGGNKDVTIWAMKDVRELSVSDASLEPAARSARSAAFATAAACIAATQEKEGLFANPLKPPGKSADPAGPWPRLLDVDQTLEFPVQLDGSRGQARRVLGSIQAVERRLRADRAGSTQSTLGTLSSLSATASLTDKLNFSQYSLGEDIKEANERKPSDNMGAAYRASLGTAATSTHEDTFQDDLLESAPSLAPADEPLTCEDELDSSPCMLPLVKLIEKAATLWKPGGQAMPAWMALLHGAVSDASVPHYVRLFLTKAVLHVDKRHVARIGADPALQGEPSIFGQFASEWFPAMVDALIGGVEKPEDVGIHYFLLDACVTFLGWPALFPVPPRGGAAPALMNYLVRAAFHEEGAVQRNNFSLLKVFIARWQTVPPPVEAVALHVTAGGPQASKGPKGRLPKPIADQRTFGLRILAAYLLYGQARAVLAGPRGKELARRAVDALGANGGQRFVTQAGETAGLLLRQLERLGPDGQAALGLSAAQLQSDMRGTLIGVFNSRPDAALFAIERLSAFHAPMVDALQSQLVGAFNSTAGLFRVLALDSLRRRAAQLPGLLDELRPELGRTLAHHNDAVQSSVLRLLSELLPREPDARAGWAIELMLTAADFTQHPSKTVRSHFFTVLRDAWQIRPAMQAGLRPPLLALLGDADAEVRGSALAFWHSALPQAMDERLRILIADSLDCASVWGERLEEQWAGSAAALLLRPAADARGYEAPIFDAELAECKFVEYPIDTWSKATLAIAPLFSASWEAASSQAASQDFGGGFSGPSMQLTQGQAGFVRATQGATASLSLNLTLPMDGSLAVGGASSRGGSSAAASSLSPETTVYRRVNNLRGNNAALLAIARRRNELKRSEVAARENKVTLMRKYRTGELPDVQRVTVAAFLAPLGVLASRDSLAAQLTVQALFKAARTFAAPAIPGLRKALALAFERTPRSAVYVGALQRMAIEDKGGTVDAASVAEAATASGSLQAGALQIEEAMLYGRKGPRTEEQPSSKRRRAVAAVPASEPSPPADEASWAALADVYMQLGEYHLAHVAYATRIARCPGTREALEAIAGRRTLTAYTLFEALMRAVASENGDEAAMDVDGVELTAAELLGGQEPSKQEEDMWFHERSRCMEEMGDWGKVLEVIDLETSDSAAAGENAIEEVVTELDDSRLFVTTDTWNGPKYLRSFVRSCLFQSSERGRLHEFLRSAAADADRMRLLQQYSGVELALEAAHSLEWDRCRAATDAAWQQFREHWAQLHPLNRGRRFEALASLQPLAELEEALEMVRSGVGDAAGITMPGLSSLVDSWRERWPSAQQPSADACLSVVSSRDLLLQALSREAAKTAALPYEAVMELRAGVALGGAGALERQGFLDTAQEILHQFASSAGASAAAATAEAKLQLLLAQAATNPGSTHIKSRLTNSLKELKQSGAAEGAARRAILKGDAQRALAPDSPQALGKAIKLYQSAADDTGSHSVDEAGTAALRLALLCDSLLKEAEEGTAIGKSSASLQGALGGDLAGAMTRSVLQALRSGGSAGAEARLSVPRLLSVMGNSADAREEWRTGWQGVPLQALLPWAAQMLSLLSQAEGDTLLPTLKELVREHKQRLYFAFRLSRQHYGPEGAARAAELEPLMACPLLERWAAALNDTSYPAQRWQAWSGQLERLLHANKKKEAVQLYREEVYPDMVGRHLVGRAERNTAAAATYNAAAAAKADKSFREVFGPEGSKLDARSFDGEARKIAQLLNQMTRDLGGRRDLSKLSPWLANYSPGANGDGEQLLVPWMPSMGGLAGALPPDIHIVGFGKTVNVFSSKQRPKELTIYGSDFKTYRWIVKGGEDVRTDERMEQILDVCNGLLARHPGAAAHQLQVRTYDVVPISSSLGIVEFVPGTQPLKESICTFLSEEVISKAWENHSGAIWAMAKRPAPHAGEAPQPGVAEYLASFHADAADATARLQATESDIRWDALREALLRNAGGPEEFLAMRANFAASMAAVSVTGYITGAGDRHTENFLLHRASGMLVPIDFGYSFGTGAQMLPIPELMPFRLTRQMRGALQPHDARDLLQAPIALGLAALRAGSGVLEGILGVFLREPLADWQREARLLQASFRARGGEPPPDEDTHVALKVQNARHKLDGRHPSAILIAELTPKHSGTKHWAALQAVVQGDARVNRRAQIKGGNGGSVLTPEEQADCLLDQATDGGILGRTWVGWRSWL